MKKFGLVGCGHRGIVGFLSTFRSMGEQDAVIALYDPNPRHLDLAMEVVGNPNCARYDDFRRFLAHPGLDTVIVTTPDNTHVDFVVEAFKAGKDVICEKPMATRLEDCRKMIAAARGRELRVAFNFRYHGVVRRVKELLDRGAIGRILFAEAQDIMSHQHGSDYFRRWHSVKKNSGGLLVHKSTHTFDVLNWWIADRPAEVVAKAETLFFTTDKKKGERCLNCRAKDTCRFYTDLTRHVEGQSCAGIENFYRRLYIEGEKHDGYIRDKCVFHETNDIEDTYAVSVRYAGGAVMNFTSLYYAPYEDKRFFLQGERGRIEMSRAERKIAWYDADDLRHEEVLPEEKGGHGGADTHLIADLVSSSGHGDQRATAEDGYWSLAVAVGANEAAATGTSIPIPAL